MGNYIFISYAHKDKDKVEPIIKYLQDSGLEVWYDKGIEVGTEWSKIIASQLVNCRMMIAFISPNYVESPNCNRETTFAVARNKPAIVAYLEPTKLTDELELSLCTWQAIYRNRFNSDEEFSQEICRSKVVRGDDSISDTTTIIPKKKITDFDNPLLKRAFALIEDGEFDQADVKLETVLDNDCECAMAYIGKLMMDLNINNIYELQNQKQPFDNNKNYIRFNRYANNDEKEQIDNYLNIINERIRKAKEENERKEKELWVKKEVGSIGTFGTYPQDENGNVQPIEWIVLENNGTSALLISKYALDCKKYHNIDKDITWDKCDLRKWLNTTFINTAFTKEEQDKIKLSNVTTDINTKYEDIPQGNNIKDKIFLFSIKEANKYFSNNPQIVIKGTPYCHKQGAWKDNKNGNCDWWLRTSGGIVGNAAGVDSDGKVDYDGYYVDYSHCAVRPALRINL